MCQNQLTCTAPLDLQARATWGGLEYAAQTDFSHSRHVMDMS